MLDYHAHVAVLRQLHANIETAFPADPSLAAQANEFITSVSADPDAAMLGACIDQIVAHASSDGVELQLLETAGDLWARGLMLYGQMSSCRQEIEAVLQQPTAPDAAQVMQHAIDGLDGLRNSAKQMAAEAKLLQAAISPLPHLSPHPRQADAPAKTWRWRDAFAARRTDAFVRAAFRGAGSVRTRAFAFGVLSCYSGNVAGSAYLGTVVGGPRRSHRYRSRLARNSVGVSIHDTFNTPTSSQLAMHMGYVGAAGTPAVPSDLAVQLRSAFAAAYPSREVPDLDLGLQRTVRHLQLLDIFKRPPLPDLPPFALALAGEPTASINFLSGSLDLQGVGDSPDPSTSLNDPGPSDSKQSSGGGCLAFLIILVTVGIALLIYCIGKWTTDEKCKVSDFFDALQGSEEPDPRAPTGTTSNQLTAISAPEVAAHVVQELFNMQMLLWQAFDTALAYLAVTGLVYPDELLMPSPLYQQFLTTPNKPAWPHREEAKSENTYHIYPTSPIEQPAATGQPFPANTPAASFIWSWAWVWAPDQHSAYPIARRLLTQILKNQNDTANYDLDADRGFLHQCWDLTPGTSITAPVLAIDILSYDEE